LCAVSDAIEHEVRVIREAAEILKSSGSYGAAGLFLGIADAMADRFTESRGLSLARTRELFREFAGVVVN
jgi:VIT1/CCC1 family predicted Fe2+/Mn2+ transporter